MNRKKREESEKLVKGAIFVSSLFGFISGVITTNKFKKKVDTGIVLVYLNKKKDDVTSEPPTDKTE